ncbi:MAG: rhomboid family intramembrane serine protease [Planctomycetaceae bacterium]
MRKIGSVSEESLARRYEDYLLVRGIGSRVDQGGDGWEVWVLEEDHVDLARQEFEQFLSDPEADTYREAASAASAVRRKKERKIKAATKRVVDTQSRWEQPLARKCPVTFALILFSVGITIATSTMQSMFELGDRKDAFHEALFIAPRNSPPGERGLRPIVHGEVWRLVTPIFLHFTLLHILFNMLWLRTLGTAIEFRRGSLRYLGLVLVIAVGSNLTQFIAAGPSFGGMSGVVFGLFGYIWMKSKYQPEVGLVVDPNTVFWMIAFFAICAFGALPNVANWAHGGGLAIGAVAGLMPVSKP